MFAYLIANAEPLTGAYPGGSSLENPVPAAVAHFTTDIGYGIFAFVVLAALLFTVTRLNMDR